MLVGGLLGLALFLVTLGPAILRPTNLGWLMRHDLQTYLLAWHHFRREPWHWPPGALPSVGYPVGTSIGNTDALPLLAFPLKTLHAVLPDPGQFFGAWLLACFVLQGVFGALLVRRFTADRTQQGLGAALFVMTPALTQRTGHLALCAHWMVLAAIWLSLADAAIGQAARRRGWLLLCAAAGATQPYIAVMVLGLALADAASDALQGQHPHARRAFLTQTASLAGVMASVSWLCGYFLVSSAGDLQLEGLGFYSLNLLAPIASMGASRLLPEIPLATPGQYEGFVYAGAGWLALGLLTCGLLATRRSALPRLRLGWIVVVVFIALGVSPVVTAGSSVLADLSAWAPTALATFRSSGRFGWLAMYVAFTAAIAAVVTSLPRRAALAVLVAAGLLQAWDSSGAFAAVHVRSQAPVWTDWANPLTSAVWDVAVPVYRHLVMVPPDMCAAVMPVPAGAHLPFSLLAGRHGVTINSGNAGRYDLDAVLRYCHTLDADMRAGRVDDDSVYVLSPAMRDTLAAATQVPLTCGRIDGFDVCVTSGTYPRWQAAAEPSDFGAVSVTPTLP